MVTEAGSFTTKGVRMTAGTISSAQETAGQMKAFKFAVAPSTSPVVVASVTTANEEGMPVNVRLAAISPTGFSYMLQEEEVQDQIHGAENISYIAWEPCLIHTNGSTVEVGRKVAAVGNTPYTLTFNEAKSTVPVMLADIQTVFNKEPACLRYTTLSPTSATLFVAEDKSKDAETTHTKETLGYILFSAE